MPGSGVGLRARALLSGFWIRYKFGFGDARISGFRFGGAWCFFEVCLIC